MNSTRRSSGVGQRVEDLAIEDEGAVDRARLRERVAERRVIEVAQVAAEPDERAVVARALVTGGGPVPRGKRRSLRAHLVAPQQRAVAVVALERQCAGRRPGR